MDELEILLKVVDTLVTLIKWDSLQNATGEFKMSCILCSSGGMCLLQTMVFFSINEEGSVILRISRRMTITRGYDLTPLLQMVSLITEVLADFRKIDGQSDVCKEYRRYLFFI